MKLRNSFNIISFFVKFVILFTYKYYAHSIHPTFENCCHLLTLQEICFKILTVIKL